MNRSNLFRNLSVRTKAVRNNVATLESVAGDKMSFDKTASTLVFAGLLLVCSIAVGCSSEKPKPQSTTNPSLMIPSTQPVVATPTSAPVAPAVQASAKPVHKKVVRKVPTTVMYADEKSGISFQYPRRFALKTGEDADKLVSTGAVPMDFVQPGGAAVAAVVIPESTYPKSDLASAFFNVSVNKTLTAEQCGEFSVPQIKVSAPADGTAPAMPQTSKLMIGDIELKSTETLASDGSRKEESKYYHAFENGSCYEFALKVATGIETDEGGKHVDREEVFKRLEKILATVKINPAPVPEVTASAPAAAPVTPAQ
jgi:hypothetical protein